MFAFLFNWTDLNWLPRRKAKKFRFTPSPVSSASIFWWTGYNGFSTRGCVLDPHVNKWYDRRFPPLSLHHGERDYLVLIDPLLERLKTHETDVEVLTVKEMRNGEHCEFVCPLVPGRAAHSQASSQATSSGISTRSSCATSRSSKTSRRRARASQRSKRASSSGPRHPSRLAAVVPPRPTA